MLLMEEVDMARRQGRFYRRMAEEGYIAKDFSDAYLSSRFCNEEMDALLSNYHAIGELFVMEELGREGFSFRKTDDPWKTPPDILADEFAFPDEAQWIGYAYRCMNFQTGLRSRQLLEKVPFKLMLDTYGYGHTVSMDTVAMDLSEICGLPLRTDRQVEDYRESMDAFFKDAVPDRVGRHPVMHYMLPDGREAEGSPDYCIL